MASSTLVRLFARFVALAFLAAAFHAAAQVSLPTITQSGLPSTATPGTTITMIVTVAASPGPVPTGTVAFSYTGLTIDGTLPLCPTANLDAAGQAPCTFTAPAPGSYTVFVDYSGDKITPPAREIFGFATAYPSSLALSGVPPRVDPGATVTALATVAAPGAPPPSGVVSFSVSDGGRLPVAGCPEQLVDSATGVAQCTFGPLPEGNYVLTADYSGDFAIGPSFASLGFRVATPAALTLTPSSLVFADTIAGTVSPQQVVTIKNVGGSSFDSMTIASSAAEFPADISLCPSSLAAAASCDVKVAFAPPAPGAFSGALVVTTKVGPETYSAALSGNGVAAPGPVVALTPRALAFAARTVGTTSPPQVVTLLNSGGAALAIASIAASGDFAFASACPALLAAGASCTISVQFTPITAGTRSGTLTIVSDAPGGPHTVALSGAGQPARAPVLELLPPVLEFLPQRVGTTSVARSVRVTNSGDAALELLSVLVQGEFVLADPPSPAPADAMPACATEVLPGAACDIHIAFQPLAVGVREGILLVLSNASREESSVRLVGAGAAPAARALSLAEVLRFGAQPVGTQSAGQQLVLANLSSAPVSISGLAATGDFAVGDGCASIPARSSCTLLVFFTPTALGARAGALSLRVLSEAEPYTVRLEGSGEANPLPLLAVSPTRLGFGSVLLGSAVEATVEIANTGQLPVALAGAVAFGDFFLRNGCGAALAPGERCTLVVSFFPRARGVRPGFVEIGGNAQGAPHRVEVSGTGCSPPNVARNRVQPLLCQ